MRIISTCKMGPGTFEAKFKPLQNVEEVESVTVLRKKRLDGYTKLKFIELPKITKVPLVNILITPFLLCVNALKVRADVILAYHIIPHGFFACFASKVTRKPYILGQTGIYVQRYAKHRIYGRFIKYIIKNASYLNVPGQESKKFWINEGVSPEKINILHSTIDTNVFKKNDVDKEYDFIYLGRLASEKKVDRIINALYELHKRGKNLSLLVVGDGNKMVEIKELVKFYNLDNFVSFVGFQENVVSWINKAKVCVITSDSEGLPTALMQAMACELICVSSNVGNIPDLIKDKTNGFLFSLNNINTLPDLLLSALEISMDQDALDSARNMVVEGYSYDSAERKWTKLLTQLK